MNKLFKNFRMVPAITDLFNNKKPTEAVSYINTLGLHSEFNIPDLVSKLIHQDKFGDASNLVSNNKEHQLVRRVIDIWV